MLRDEAAFLLDNLLVRVARGRGALDLAMAGKLLPPGAPHLAA